MKILDRYLMRSFAGTFVLLLLGLPMLFMIIDLTDQLDKYLDRGIGMDAVALSYLYQIPQNVQYAFPIAALVATVFTIGNMTRHQEVAAAKAGGVSFYRLIAPIVGIAVVFSVFALALGELVPVTNSIRAEMLGEREQHSRWRTNFVFQTDDGSTLAVRRLDAVQQEMSEVVLERQATAGRAGVHQIARSASWQPNVGWTFNRGYMRLLDGEGAETAFEYQTALVTGLDETPAELLAEPKAPEEMRYAELQAFIADIERSGGDAGEYPVELAQKISLPLAVLVIVLFGAPLATTSGRRGAAFGIGVSLAVTLVYLLLFKVATAVGGSGAVDPIVAAWFPNGLFLAGAFVLLARVRT